MAEIIQFNIASDLALGLQKLIEELEQRIDLSKPIKMFIAGGMATHLYTNSRVTLDVDAEFSSRILLPKDLLIETKDGNMLYLDTNYNSSFALMHEDYLENALRVPIGTDLIEVYVLSPVDLIVSKLARFSGPDAGDIQSIVNTFNVAEDVIRQRAEEALAGYIGNQQMLRLNLEEVLRMAQKIGKCE